MVRVIGLLLGIAGEAGYRYFKGGSHKVYAIKMLTPENQQSGQIICIYHE